ncbi:MAG: ABC transporter permease [Firmicutes bacterium]|nr:ABC transporter permease [Bacillota bacterium]
MKTILKSFKRAYTYTKPSLIAIGIGLFIGLIIMLIFNPGEAFQAMFTLIIGGFNGGLKGIGNMLYQAAPLILTGLAVAFAFKTGLFNIGASGQMMIGAYVAIYVGVTFEFANGLHWVVGLLFGMMAGALWGLIPGLLKAISNVNEVVATIMLNYIAGHLLIFLIKTFTFNAGYSRSATIRTTAELPKIDFLFPSSSANIGIFIAIGVAILAHILIHRTTLGFELRASGFSVAGSKFAGMNTKRNIIISMTIAGMFAGLAGATAYLVAGKTIGTVFAIFPEGFDGISVALLGLGEPLGALFAGIFLSNLRMGGYYMQIYGFVPQITDIITAVIIYVTAVSVVLQVILKRYGDQIKTWFAKRRVKEAK